jgi:hypothetical protein
MVKGEITAMSFSFYSLGTKKGVRREAENFKPYGEASQWEAAKTLILAEVDACPDSIPALEVRAGGHHDERSRNLSIEIKPIWSLALDPEDPKPDQPTSAA